MRTNTRELLIEKYIKPSGIRYVDENFFIEFYKNKYGELHRDKDQPAEIWYKNGKIRYKCWYKNGNRHRDSGNPAIILYNNGKIKILWWYKNGECIKSKKYK